MCSQVGHSGRSTSSVSISLMPSFVDARIRSSDNENHNKCRILSKERKRKQEKKEKEIILYSLFCGRF